MASNFNGPRRLSPRVTPPAANRDRSNDGFPPTATSTAKIPGGRSTLTSSPRRLSRATPKPRTAIGPTMASPNCDIHRQNPRWPLNVDLSLRRECAITGHPPTAWRTGEFDRSTRSGVGLGTRGVRRKAAVVVVSTTRQLLTFVVDRLDGAGAIPSVRPEARARVAILELRADAQLIALALDRARQDITNVQILGDPPHVGASAPVSLRRGTADDIEVWRRDAKGRPT